MLPTHLGLDMAVDKFFSLGMLTFTTHYKQFCGVCYVLYPSHRNAKIWGPNTYLSSALLEDCLGYTVTVRKLRKPSERRD